MLWTSFNTADKVKKKTLQVEEMRNLQGGADKSLARPTS